MKKRPKNLFFPIARIATLFSLIVLFALPAQLLHAEERQRQTPYKNKILVTRSLIREGEEFTSFNVYWATWPDEPAPIGTIMVKSCPDAITQLSGHRARTSYDVNEIIQPRKLDPPGFKCQSSLPAS